MNKFLGLGLVWAILLGYAAIQACIPAPQLVGTALLTEVAMEGLSTYRIHQTLGVTNDECEDLIDGSYNVSVENIYDDKGATVSCTILEPSGLALNFSLN